MNATDWSMVEVSSSGRRPGATRRPMYPRPAFAAALLAALVLLGVLAGAANADIFWASLPPFCFEASCESFVGHANQDGSGANSEFAAGAPHGLVQSGEYLYGTVGPSIAREETNGSSGLEPAFIVLPGAFKGAKEYEGELTLSKLAVHGEYIYWASCHRIEGNPVVEAEIGRARLNGTEVIPNFIRDNGLSGNSSCTASVAADANHLYWTRENGTIGRANLNGTGIELEFVKGVGPFVSGLAVNEHYIYWNTLFNGEIGRATISGGEVNNGFIKLARKKLLKGEEGTPEDGGIAVDEGHLYWAEESTIGRANLDGSNVEESFIPSAVAPPDGYINGLAVGSSPVLQASISVTGVGGAPLTGANTTVGSTVEAKVTVSAPASDKGPVSALAAHPSLTVDPAPALKPVSGPLPSSIDGRSLAPGGGFSYTDIYTIATTGHADLSVEVTGQYSGSPTSAQATQTAALGQPLEVSVGWLSSPNGPALVLNQPGRPPLPNTIRLGDEDKGEIPQEVTALVTIKNTSAVTEENVSLNGIPALSYHSASHALQALPVGVVGTVPNGTIGSLAPGAEAKVEYTVRAAGNGEFDFSPQVLSSDSVSTGTNISQGVGTLTALPTALLWLSLHRVNPGLIRAGLDTEISGTVTNRSLTQTIEVDPLEAEHEGNAGSGELVSDTSTIQPDGVHLPFQGKIAPGETVDVTGHVYTAVEPESLGKVTYEPTGVVLAADGSSTSLKPSQIGASAGSSEFAIGTEAGEPALPEATLETVLDNFSDAAVKGVGQWSVNELSAAANLLLHPIAGAYGIGKGIAAFAVGGGHAVADASYFVSAVYLLSVAGESMTADERGEFANQIVADFEASHLKADYSVVAQAAGKVLGSFEDAVKTGDYNQVGALAGGTLATGLTAAADALLSDIAFQKIAIGIKYAGKKAAKAASGNLANAVTLADSIREAKATATLGKTLKGIEAGTNLLLDGAVALTDSFGLTSRQITELRNYCQRSKIIIAVRSRSGRAAELIKKGLAVGKNEIIKLKAVNQYDVEFLGYRPANLNTVVWAEPLSETEVVDELIRRKASAETEKIVLERLKLRQDEWADPKIRHVIEDAKKSKRIEWSFDGAGNEAPGATRKQVRRFELQNQPSPVKGTSGRTYQEVLIGNKPGVNPLTRLVPITQDVDLMALLKPDGSIMSIAERVDAYIHLSDILGIEHGETPSWVLDGEIMFQKKAKQLADVIPGGEQLAIFAPTGAVTAGFFNPALTIFDNTNKGGRIFFQGGYNNPYSLTKTTIELRLKGMG
jgi:hypothetical protein